MDGTLITALRTACMGAIGAKYLARKDAKTYGTIGTFFRNSPIAKNTIGNTWADRLNT